jgi:hypothetical protein
MAVEPLGSIEGIEEPWTRFDPDRETAKAFAAFSIYRDLGPTRTYSRAYREYSGRPEAKYPPGYFKDWYEKLEWRARAAAYDRSLDEAVRAEIQEAYRTAFDTLAKSARIHISTLIQIASGRRPVPVDLPDGTEQVGENVQLAAARDALDRLGVRAPDRVEARVDKRDDLTSWVDLLHLASGTDRNTRDSDDE